MKTPHRTPRILSRSIAAALAVPLIACLPQSSQAASATWNQTAAGTYDWGTNANWNPNTTFPNGASDVASINNDIAGNITINLATGSAANRTVSDLNLGDSTGTSTFTIAAGVAGSTLIFAGARTMDITGAGANTISAGIQASGGNLTFRSTATAETTISGVIANDGTARSITFNNDINGTTTAAASNQGQFALTAANTIGGTTGTVTINDVRVRGTIAGAFGANAANTITVAGAGQLYLTAGTHVNNLVLNSTGWGETAGNFGALRIENATVSGTVTLQQNITIGVNSNVTGTLSGVISGAFGITKVGGTATSGQGELLLSGANTFTGPVTVNNGTIRASNASALGTNTNVTVNASPTAGGDGNRLALSGGITIGAGKTLTLNSNGTGDFRSMLINTANNNTWAGNIVAAGTGLTQVSAAANTTLTITGGITSSSGAGTGTLFNRGAGTVVYNGVINLGTDRKFSKTDAGTVIVNSTGNSWTQTQVANGQIQIGANNALAVGANFIFGEANANNGRLELNGFSQTVDGISTFGTSTGTNHILRNSNLTTASTLTFATPAATTNTLKDVQVFGTANGLGTLHLVSNGLGRTEFQNGLVSANSWTVNSGTLAFTGNTSRILPGIVTGLVGATIEKAGASTLAAQSAWNNAGTTNITGGTLAVGAGTAGAFNVSDGATLSTGLGGGVLNSSAVTFGTAGATSYVPLLTAPALPAPLNAASLTTSGTTVTITPLAGSFTTGTYRLLDYTGTIGGNGPGGFALGAVGTYPHMTAMLDTTTAGQVNLAVSAVDSLIWAGQTNGVWDTNTTSNFALASSPSTGATFYVGDAVVFGDTQDVTAPGAPVTNSTITGGAVTVGNLSFTNSAVTYSVANALSGAGGVSKSGTGAVTLSGANSYAGPTNVSGGTLTLSGANTLPGAVNVTGGTLRIGNSDALRGVAVVTVSSGGTFDANGTAVGNRFNEIVFSGAGVGGNGAIVNNGAGIANNSHFTKYTMAGSATWGGSGRYDITTNQIFNGGAFTLTKTGAGELWYNPAAGSVLENVIVNGGFFGSQGANPLSTTATVTVNNTGTHQVFGANAQQHLVVLNDGGTLRQSNGAAGTINGQVTLNGTTAGRNIQAVSGGTLNIAGKLTGTGGFTVNDAGTVQLQNATNDYAGDTVISAGTLNFNATGIIPATTNLIVNGGTFATGNLPRTVGSLSGTGGTISGGNILTTNQSTTTVWNGNLNSTTTQMSGSGSLTLGGTGDNSSGIAIVNSGTLIFAKGNTTAVSQAIHSVGGAPGVTVNGGTLQLGGTYDNTTTPGTGINLAPVGINTTTYVDQIYNNVGVVLNAGTFDLNGRQEAINTLTNPAGVGGTVTNTSATAAKLYIGHQNGSSTFAGAINDGTGTVAIEKIGTGTLTLTGASNFTGGLTQTAGAVTVNTGASLGNTPITVAANTFTFDGTHGTGAIAVNGTSIFAGAGTSGGTLTAASGTTVRVGAASVGTAATTLTLGGLTLSGGTNLNLDFNTTGTTVDKVATTVSNGLSISGANPLNVVLSGAGWVPGTYPILTYVGAVQGTGANNTTLVLSTPVGHSTVNVVDDTFGNVNLVVAGAANKWVGGNGNAWDTNTTLNWNAGDQKFLTGDTVLFDDSATTFTPNIAANQIPAGVTFDNTTAYTLTSTGAFGIAGTGGLIKKNTGTVTISSANTYTGTTDVQQGTLIANYNTGTAQTVFAAASPVNVAAGATLRVVANDANITFANNLTGSGLVVIDPHLTAGAAVRDVAITGNNAGFTGMLKLSPTTNVADGNGTFRTSSAFAQANAGGATIDVDLGGQLWLNAGTLTNNVTITGMGYAEVAGGTPVAASGLTQYSGTNKGGIGAIRLGTATISGNITLDGSAKIMAYGSTGTLSGSISITNPTDILSIGGGQSGTTLILTGTNNVGGNALKDVFVNSGGTTGTNILQIGNLGTTGTLGTGAVTLYNDAAGAQLTIQRSDGYTMMQNVTAAHNGTATNLTKARFVVNTQGTGVSLNGYTIDLTDGTNTAANAGGVFVAGVGGGSGVNNAVFNIDGSSAVKTGTFFIGDAANFSGTVTQSGTSDVQVASHMRVGHYPTETSAYNLSAGTLTVANINTGTDPSGGSEQTGGIYLGVDGTGTMAHSGGTVTTDWIVLDNRGNTGPGANMPDGIDRYNLSGSGLLVLRSQWGITQRNTSTAVSLAGGTIRNGGTNLQVRLDTAPDISGAVTLDTVSAGNSFNWLRDAAGAGSLALSGGGTLKFTTTGTQSVSVPISGTGALEKLGAGTTTLSSANTYNGATTISAGTLKLGAPNALPSGAGKGDVVFSAAGTNSILDLNGFDTSINGLSQPTTSTLNLVVNNAAATSKTLTFGNNNATATFAGIIADNTGTGGTLALTKVGTGTQTLSGASTFTGPINVDGGLIAFPSSPAASGPLGNSTVVNLNGGGISYTAAGTNALNRSLAIGAGSGTLDVANPAGILTLAGANVSSTGGNLIKTGAGAVMISGTTTLGGGAGVVVNDGTLQAGFGTGGVSTINVGSTGNLSMQNSAIEALTLGNSAGALTLAGGSKLGFEFNGATNDSIAVGATGTALLTSGVITLDLFNFGAGITSGNTYTLLSAGLGDLTFGGLASYAIGTAPSGFNYSLTATSTAVTLGVVAFSPAYWTDSQGTGSWSTLNPGPLSNFNTLATGGANLGALPGANETVFFSENGVGGPTVTSTLDGNFTIYGLNFVAGSGTVTAVNINQGTSGTLTIRPSTAAGGIDVGANAGVVTIGAPLVASNTNSATQTWNVDGTGANGSSLTLNGVVNFDANVIKTGAGTLTLGNAGNTGSGNFTLNGGTLDISATGNVPTGVFTIGGGTTINNSGAGAVTFSNSAYNWNGNFTHSGQSLDLGSGAVTLGASAQVTVATSTLTVGGAIGDGVNTFGITKAGAGTLVLGGTNTYNGPTSITAGMLSLTGSLTGGGAISTSGTAVLSQSATGAISGASTITQGSSGTSVLAGNNAHTGLTSVTAGVLTLSGNNSSATGGVTLTAGQLNINSDNALGTGRLTLSGGTFDNTDASAHTQLGNPVQTWTNAANVPFTGTQALNLGTGAVTLGTDATAGSFTLTNNSTLPGTSLTVGGNISAIAGGTAGVKTLTIAGPGSTALTGNLTRGAATALDVTVTSPGTTTLSGAASTIRTLNVNGGAASIVELGAGSLTLSNAGSSGIQSTTGGTISGTGGGTIVLGSGGADNLNNGTANGTTLTINAQITGAFGWEIFTAANNTGTTVLTAQNTFAGNVFINGGNLQVSSVGNTGSLTSNLGSGTTINLASSAVGTTAPTSGILRYMGLGETSNRIINLSGTTVGGAIEQAGAGLLKFTGANTVTGAGVKTLYLMGSTAGAGEIAGALPNNGGNGVSKFGSGTWTLSGLSATAGSNYAGATVINQGTLAITHATTAALTGGLTFGAAAANTTVSTLDLTGGNATFTGAALVRTNSTSANTITIGAAKTLTLNGGLTLGYDAAGGTGATDSKLTVTGGTMAVNGTTIDISVNQAATNAAYFSRGTLDVTALAAFNTNVTNFNIGVGSTTTGVGNVLLSNTANTILATTLTVGNTGSNNGNGISTLTLGTGTNVLQADTIEIGKGKSSSPGVVTFVSQTTGSPGTVTIANKAGTGRANITVANNNGVATAGGAVGTLDLRGHVATVNAETLLIAQTNAASNNAGTTGTVRFDAGTFDVNTLTMAPKTGASTGTATATLDIGGGSFTVNTAFTLGSQASAGASVATLNLTGGTFTSTPDITRGAGAVTSTINLDGGTLDMTNNAIGIGANQITLNAKQGTLQNLSQLNGGGTLSKSTTGTLILTGTNAYTGLTDVTAGIVRVQSNTGLGGVSAGTSVASGANLQFESVTLGAEALTLNGTGTASQGALSGTGTSSASGTVLLASNSSIGVAAAGDQLTLSGVISGTGASTLTKVGLGTLVLNGAAANTFTGATTINAGTLEAGAAGALGATTDIVVNTGGTLLLSGTGDRVNDSTTTFTLAGGKLDAAGLSETFGALTLTDDSIIDFGSGASTLTFADSTNLWAFGKTLNIWNWSGTPFSGGGTDQLRFASNGLNATQLSQINFFSDAGFNKISITPQYPGNGFVSFGEVVPIPEPSGVVTVLALLGLAGWRERRNTRANRTASRAA